MILPRKGIGGAGWQPSIPAASRTSEQAHRKKIAGIRRDFRGN
jgi:hypothetical protein